VNDEHRAAQSIVLQVTSASNLVYTTLLPHADFQRRNTDNMISGVRGGRGRWQRGSAFPRPAQAPIHRPPPPPIGLLLESITPEQLDGQSGQVRTTVKINDCDLLASFNWADNAEPSIIFPGVSSPSFQEPATANVGY